ncbi:unnamed protein product [Rotaria sp. Silwood1]|nr:unnamed protein product [Rotaria sp. Silwood1]
MFKSKFEQQDIDEMVDSNDNDQSAVVYLSNSLSSLASITRRASPTSDMIETTADGRRRDGLYNPDYYINETNKHLFPPISEDNLRKEC